ncbi:MAG: TIGR03982 family His-Xaa-Ser system protein [Candidatus Thiodiazotropha taylori]
MIRWSQVIIAGCLLTVILIEYVRPWLAYSIYQDKFKKLAFECDLAMHDEVAIRNLTGDGPAIEALKTSSNIQLAICHEYDKLRKRLLIYRVSEEHLALLGLEVLETERIPVELMVDPHRMSRL